MKKIISLVQGCTKDELWDRTRTSYNTHIQHTHIQTHTLLFRDALKIMGRSGGYLVPWHVAVTQVFWLNVYMTTFVYTQWRVSCALACGCDLGILTTCVYHGMCMYALTSGCDSGNLVYLYACVCMYGYMYDYVRRTMFKDTNTHACICEKDYMRDIPKKNSVNNTTAHSQKHKY